MSPIAYKNSPYRAEVRNMQAEQAPKTRELVYFTLSPAIVMWMLALAVVLLGMGFLASYNKVATKGYYLKRLELAKQDLIDEKQKVDLAISKSKSLTLMLAEDKLEGYRKAGKIEFISVADSFIAKNQ